MALTSDQITAQNFADFYNTILPYLNGGGMGLKLLWENSDPTQSFVAQNIELSSDDYDLLLCIYNWSTTSNDNLSNVSVKGNKIAINLASNNSSNVARNYERYGTPTDAIHIAFTDCTYTGGTTDNRNAIPYRIYGIKVYNRDVPGKTTLLWSNPNPSSAFAAQDVTLANSDYDQLTIICDTYINAKTFVSVITVKGNGAVISYTRYDSGSSPRTRTFTYTDATHLSVGDALVNGAANNSHLIPMYVYGTKL